MFIFFGTLIELIGFRAVMGDLNVCIVMGFMSYGVILAGGIRYNKFHGALETLRNFSLPFSMSFRLFGAIIGGVLVNELIYDGFSILSMTVILPVFVSVMFTLMHAVVQTYILTLLTSMFFGTSSAPYEKAVKKRRRKKEETVSA
jgi:F-type H+-transporting ATPase subunit a